MAACAPVERPEDEVFAFAFGEDVGVVVDEDNAPEAVVDVATTAPSNCFVISMRKPQTPALVVLLTLIVEYC